MTKINKLKRMFELQEQLNIDTCGKEWKNGTCEKTGKVINWNIAIIDECSELIRSLDLFHWKRGKVDKENAILEVVDLYHFVMCITIENDRDYVEVIKDYLGVFNKTSINFSLYILEQSSIGELISVIPFYTMEDSYYKVFAVLEMITIKLGYTFDDIYRIYLTKNTLNKFRNNHGYQNGTYKNIWNNQEDNYWAMQLGERLYGKLDEDKLDNFQDYLYEELEELYKEQ